MIKNASGRIYICDYEYSFNASFKCVKNYENISIYRSRFLKELLSLNNKNLDIKGLSQTFVDKNKESHGLRSPQNKNNFSRFITQFKMNKLGEYSVNDAVHSKFIIVDDILIISTCNFTLIQFIYLKYVDVPKFDNMPDKIYKGIYCEVGQFIFIKDKELCEEVIKDFMSVWNLTDIFHVKNALYKKCGKDMKIYDGRYRKFWGYTEFPKCKYTKKF